MNLLAPLDFLALLRALIFGIICLVLPGYLFLRLKMAKSLSSKVSKKLHQFLHGHHEEESSEEESPLFEGFLEEALASLALSLVISSLVFILLTFTIGLYFATAFAGIGIVVAVEAYFVWKGTR